jgi:hypothetical protein
MANNSTHETKMDNHKPLNTKEHEKKYTWQQVIILLFDSIIGRINFQK